MSSQTSIPQTGEPHGPPVRKFLTLSFWLKELPFSIVLIMTLAGVAYTSFSKQPMTGYWELLAPLIALICIASGWQGAKDYGQRLRLVATQVLHWLAFLLVMNLMLLQSVQRVFNAGSAGIAIFTLLALGTFTAGVHAFSWQVCLLGVIMALGIPAIAWIENSALLVLLAVAVVLGIGVVLWWYWHEWRAAED